MRTLFCVLTAVLLSSCHQERPDRDDMPTPGSGDSISDKTGGSGDDGDNTDDLGDDGDNTDDSEDDGDNTDDSEGDCSKDCDDICDSWGEADNFSSYEGDVSTCSADSYTLTRTGTSARTCPDITCDGTKKECPTTKTVTETTKQTCECSTAGEKCSTVDVCLQRACEDGRQRCRNKTGSCTQWGKKKVCTKTNDGEKTCYDYP